MLVLRWKPIEKILEFTSGSSSVLVLGCRGCASVCSAGGQKEVEELERLLRLAALKNGRSFQVRGQTLERQCDPEFIQPLADNHPPEPLVLSLACGAGVQLLAEKLSARRVLPAADTLFVGVAEEKGRYAERCQACGDCKLHLTGGVCPISRCAKSLLNGPCGGSQSGHCEIDPGVPCAWQLIIERLSASGQLEALEKIIEPADWSSSRDGGPRRLEREDLT
jgi:ferredoxin